MKLAMVVVAGQSEYPNFDDDPQQLPNTACITLCSCGALLVLHSSACRVLVLIAILHKEKSTWRNSGILVRLVHLRRFPRPSDNMAAISSRGLYNPSAPQMFA